ncbi:MAG: sigma factor-like helix-turn-helix DNA-binding protein [Pseudomonadota bacterium]
MSIEAPSEVPGLVARLSRFALCIAPSSGHALSALDAIEPFENKHPGDTIAGAFRALLGQMSAFDQEDVSLGVSQPRSIVARFSSLPYHQRVAFALVVIEEFSIEEAAGIMGLDEPDVRSLLLATRDFLFSNHWTLRADA